MNDFVNIVGKITQYKHEPAVSAVNSQRLECSQKAGVIC